MQKFLGFIVMCLLLTGCTGLSSKPGKDCVCKLNQNDNGINMEVTETLVNNKKKVFSDTLEIKVMTNNESEASQTETLLRNNYSLIASIEGVVFDTSVDQLIVTMTVTIDYDKVSLKDLMAIGFVQSEESRVDYIDFDMTVENLTAQGFNCEFEK